MAKSKKPRKSQIVLVLIVTALAGSAESAPSACESRDYMYYRDKANSAPLGPKFLAMDYCMINLHIRAHEGRGEKTEVDVCKAEQAKIWDALSASRLAASSVEAMEYSQKCPGGFGGKPP